MDIDWKAELLDHRTRPTSTTPAPVTTPIAKIVMHIHREVIHHGAEICLLRDLYLRKDA